jgi:hypothetical protein
VSEIAERVLEGHVASGSRVIRWLEDGQRDGIEALNVIYRNGPVGAHLSECPVSVVRKTPLELPIPSS